MLLLTDVERKRKIIKPLMDEEWVPDMVLRSPYDVRALRIHSGMTGFEEVQILPTLVHTAALIE